MKLISVVIPLYNSEEYISECVHSIIDNYKYDDLEIIIVNDGSTDKSADIVRSLMDNDKRIVLINQANKGPSVARNRGLAEAEGKYILFVDSDDSLVNEALTHCRDLLVVGDYDTVIMNSKRYTKDNKVLSNKPLFEDVYTYNEQNKKDIYKRLVSTGDLNALHAKFYSNKIIKEKNIRFNKDIIIGEDRVFNLDYFYFSRNGIYNDLYLYNYRYNPASLTKTFGMSKFIDLKKTHNARMMYIERYDLDEDAKNQANIYTINSLFQLVSTAINSASIKDINKELDDPLFTALINDSEVRGIKNRFKLFILRKRLYKLMRLLIKVKVIKWKSK